MARMMVLYKTPADASAFDRYYFATHAPLAKKMPGLRRYEVSDGAVAAPGGASGIHLVAILEFDSMAAIKNAIASPEGKAAVADLPNFAGAGADVLLFEARTV